MKKKILLATRARPSFANATRKIVPRSRIASLLTRRWDRLSARSCSSNKREAERRQTHLFHWSRIKRMRLRVQRDALACRRSTTALAAANQRRSSTPERASWDLVENGRYPLPAYPSPATKSQTGHRAGRASSRSRPGAEVTSPRPREPLSLRQPVSPAGVLYMSEIRDFVPEMETDVKASLSNGDDSK